MQQVHPVDELTRTRASSRRVYREGGWGAGAGALLNDRSLCASFVRSMTAHWSGVGIGEYFDAHDPVRSHALPSQSEVVVPCIRSPPMDFPNCMLEETIFNVRSSAGDSEYHIIRLLRGRVAPLLLGAKPAKHTVGATHPLWVPGEC